MTILLPELRTAFVAAVNSVTTSVSVPVADNPVAISPNEDFTFTVTANNTGANTTRMINVVYHVKIEPSNRGQLRVPLLSWIVARSGPSPTSPSLNNPFITDPFVSEMWLFPTDDTLDVGGSHTITGLKGRALALGSVTLSCHVHCDPDLNYLFPGDEQNANGTRVFQVT